MRPTNWAMASGGPRTPNSARVSRPSSVDSGILNAALRAHYGTGAQSGSHLDGNLQTDCFPPHFISLQQMALCSHRRVRRRLGSMSFGLLVGVHGYECIQRTGVGGAAGGGRFESGREIPRIQPRISACACQFLRSPPACVPASALPLR